MGGGAYDAQFSLGLAHSVGAQLEPQWDWETETSAEPGTLMASFALLLRLCLFMLLPN